MTTLQEPGRIGLVSTSGFAAKAIRLASEGHWNHVVIARGDGQCFSAEPGGVRLRNEDAWLDTAWLTNEPLTATQGEARVTYCASRLGAAYDYWAILAFSKWWVPTPQWFIRWANDRPTVICSELAVLAANASGTSWFPDRLPATVAPAAIDVEFRRRGW